MIGAKYWNAAWNPLVGCTPVSPGCQRCWAASMSSRFHPELAAKGKWLVGPQLHPERLDQPLRWRKPRTVFVCNMSDLFHEDVPGDFIAAVFGVMAATPQHRYLVLTKRPERMRWRSEWMRKRANMPAYHWGTWPLVNVWLGTSIENQRTADERLPELLATPAAHRWLSVEPLLEAVDLGELDGISWVVCGAESGPGARPCRVEWVRSVVEQCRDAGVAVFVKQLSREDGGADMSRWPADLQTREIP